MDSLVHSTKHWRVLIPVRTKSVTSLAVDGHNFLCWVEGDGASNSLLSPEKRNMDESSSHAFHLASLAQVSGTEEGGLESSFQISASSLGLHGSHLSNCADHVKCPAYSPAGR